VVETFHSVQGEGFWTGSNAFFLRLGGCDVYCPWCDQKESWNAHRYPQQSLGELVEMAKGANPAMVVITGGEPLMHNLDPLTKELKNQGLRVHLETSGAHPFTGVFDWVTFSPKTYKMPDPTVISYQLSVISYQLSVISYQLSGVSYQLSVISYQESVSMKKFSPPQMKEVSFPTPHTLHPLSSQEITFYLFSPLPNS